jgi:UDP-3-O-[3-hydroxymyristoyl] glucosamine N-acyltransferase
VHLHALTLAEAAEMAGATLEGDPGRRIWFGARLEEATPEALSFFDGRQPAGLLGRTRAGAVLVPEAAPGAAPAAGGWPVPAGTALLRTDGPHRSFMTVVRALWERRARPPAGVAATARVHPAARVADDAYIGDGCVIGAGAGIASGAALHANAVVGDLAVIGPGTVLGPGAVVGPGAVIGAGCVVHSGAVVGYAYRPTPPGAAGLTKPPSYAGVVLGDGVEIGPNAVIEEGEREPTTIADGARVGSLSHVGHDCSIGPGAELVAMVGLASEVRVGAEAMLMGQVGVANGVRVGDRSVVFGKSGVIGHVPDDGRYMGNPAWPQGEWMRAQARLRRDSRARPAGQGQGQGQGKSGTADVEAGHAKSG